MPNEPLDIDELERMEKAATPGPWEIREVAHEASPYSKRRVYRVEIRP